MGAQARVSLVLRRLSGFADGAGWPVDVDVLSHAAVIEAFCRHGLAGRASSTQGTYRSVLRLWAGLADVSAVARVMPVPARLPRTRRSSGPSWWRSLPRSHPAGGPRRG